jgi:hypothetical protein
MNHETKETFKAEIVGSRCMKQTQLVHQPNYKSLSPVIVPIVCVSSCVLVRCPVVRVEFYEKCLSTGPGRTLVRKQRRTVPSLVERNGNARPTSDGRKGLPFPGFRKTQSILE